MTLNVPPPRLCDLKAQLARRLGLRGRLILLLLVAFAVLIGTAVWHLLGHRAEMIDNARNILLAEARLIAARQQTVAAQADAILSGMMEHPALRPGTPVEECTGALTARLRQEAAFVNLGWAWPNGDVACSSAIPLTGPVNYADRAWFPLALQSERMVVSEVLIGRALGRPLIAFARAMRDEAGQVTGVLYLSLDLARLREEMARIDLPPGTSIVVVDGKGVIAVRHPNPEGWTGRTAPLPLLEAIRSGGREGTMEEIGLDGARKYSAFTPLLDTIAGRMTLRLAVPKDTVLAPAQRELANTLSLVLAVLLATIGLVYRYSDRWLLRPLLAISRQLTRFAAGDHSVRSGLPHSDDGIGRLARTLDETADQLEAGALRFRAVAEASLDSLFILTSVRGEDGKILDFQFSDINTRAGAMLGMTREEVVGQRLCELLPVYRSGGYFDKYVAVAETGVPLEEEFPIDTPQIRAKWLRHQAVRVGDGIAITSRDVTAWKEVGMALRKSEQKLRLLAESLDDVVYRANPRTLATTYANPAVEKVFGYSVEEWLGDPALWERTVHPQDRQRVFEIFEEAQRRIEGGHVEYRIIRKDNSLRWVSDRFVWEKDPQGAAVSLNGVLHDITDRKMQERALARALRALKTLSAGNQELVHATDEQELLWAICRIIVEQGGYRMAWVAYADYNPEKTVTPMAWAGAEEGYLAQLRLTWADDQERGLGPASRSIRTGEPQVTHDIRTDPGYKPWRELAEKHGYVSNLTIPLKVNGRTIGTLGIYAAEADAFDAEEIELLSELGDDLAFGIASLRIKSERDRITWQHVHHAEILQRSLEQSIQAIADTVDARDPYTAGHQRRVAALATAIAREMGLPEESIHGIHLAGMVHDLGKIQVPAEILAKPGRLTEIEFMLIKTHPQAGYDILKNVEFPWPIADIVRQHHEKLDGSGYPQGLKNGEILLESRIMAVADVVEAMSSHRPYRSALGIDTALQEIERGRGTAYDAAVADACLKLFREGKFSFDAWRPPAGRNRKEEK